VLVERAYSERKPTHRKLLELLAAKAGTWVSFTEISQPMDYASPRSLPGTLGAFGRCTKHRYGGFRPFDAREDAATGECS
jgi:hypothetical protein